MSVATVHPDPWTTDALPEDGMRHELLDGTLQRCSRPYAEAGIGVFIRVELDTVAGQPELLVHELAGGAYHVTAGGRGTEPTTVAVPSPVTVTASDLTGRGT